MVQAVVIQRVVPHYRVPVFERLHRELGWRVVCNEAAARHGLNCARPEDHLWLIGVPFRSDPDHQYRAMVPLSRILAETAAEALVCEFSLQLSSSWQLALRGLSIPFAFWSQGWNRERGFDRMRDRMVHAARLALLRRADAQLTYDEEGADYLRRQVEPGRPVFVARNTLATETMPGRSIDASPRDPLAPHVISIGRLTPEKHVPRVIEAFGRLLARYPGAKLTVVGDGPDLPAVTSAAARVGGAVELRGAVYADEDVAAIFQTASLLVVGGSVGLSVNHALAYGVPVMIYDDPIANHHHPEHSYVIEDVTGFRVREAGVEALADAMARALVPPGPRARLGESLRRYVDQEMSLDRMLDGFRQLDAFFARQGGHTA